MKKIIYSLGLSVLLSQPALAQEQAVAQPSSQTSELSPEDAQTIFFSEDFLNELTSDSDEVQIFNDIPLDKTDTIPLDKTKAPEVKTPAPQATPPEVKAPAPQTPASQVATPEVKAPAPQTPAPQVATPEIKAPAPQTPAPQVTPPEVKAPAPQMPAPQATPPEVKAPAKETISQTEDKPSSPEVSTSQQTLSQPLLGQESSPQQPTIQEIIQEKSAPVAQDISIAPSRPKKNAFSLDDASVLPQSVLNEDALSTNMLNRGIRISPEQRARMMMKKKFVEMDLNGDGVITKQEFIQFKTAEAQRIATQVYKQIDTNGDDILSEAEYDVLMDKMIENYIKAPQKK